MRRSLRKNVNPCARSKAENAFLTILKINIYMSKKYQILSKTYTNRPGVYISAIARNFIRTQSLSHNLSTFDIIT